MKKQDMIDKIVANFEYIEGINERNLDTIYTGQTRQVYLVPVKVPQVGKMVEETFKFVVYNEGQAGEEAFWLSADPVPPTPEPRFQDEMMAWLSSQLDEQVGPYIVRHIEGTTANNALERGAAALIVEDGAGDFVRKSVAVWKDTQDNFQFQIIKE